MGDQGGLEARRSGLEASCFPSPSALRKPFASLCACSLAHSHRYARSLVLCAVCPDARACSLDAQTRVCGRWKQSPEALAVRGADTALSGSRQEPRGSARQGPHHQPRDFHPTFRKSNRRCRRHLRAEPSCCTSTLNERREVHLPHRRNTEPMGEIEVVLFRLRECCGSIPGAPRLDRPAQCSVPQSPRALAHRTARPPWPLRSAPQGSGVARQT